LEWNGSGLNLLQIKMADCSKSTKWRTAPNRNGGLEILLLPSEPKGRGKIESGKKEELCTNKRKEHYQKFT